MKEKPTVDTPFFKAFASDRISRAMKDVSVHFFFCSSNSCKLYQQIPVIYTSKFWELFEATTFMFFKCLYNLFDIVTIC
jgi:hypothetical protein